MDTQHLGFDSKLVHAGIPDDPMGSAVTPIYQTSTFAFRDAQQGADRFAGKAEGYIYTRIGNPTINALEVAMAQLENGVGGVATSSGMSAVSTVYLALLSAGDHVVSQASVYGPSRILMEKHMSRFGVESTFLDTTDLAAVKAAIKPNTKIIYVESPGNPGMQVTDLVAVAELAHAHGALVVVDNTFASPYLQRPLDLGCDVVLHSITKFINGHADVVGGVLVAKDEAIYKQLRAMMVMSGCNMDPHQAWLVSRGLKTLSIRVDRAQQSAQEIAKWLEKHPKIEWVSYLGLPSHPQYE
ncbi:MAG: PLP-dependent aspartate aminotransferase family protein, partial [Holophaga sp.]